MKNLIYFHSKFEKIKKFFSGNTLIDLYKKTTGSIVNGLNNFMDEIKQNITNFTMKKFGYDFSSTYDSTIEDGWNCSKNLITVKWDRINLKWNFFSEKNELTFVDFAFLCIKNKHICNAFVGKYYNYKFSDEKLNMALEKIKSNVQKKITEQDFKKILDTFKLLNQVGNGRKLGAIGAVIPALALAASSSLSAILAATGLSNNDKIHNNNDKNIIETTDWKQKDGIYFGNTHFSLDQPSITEDNKQIKEKEKEQKIPLIDYHPNPNKLPDSLKPKTLIQLGPLESFIILINTLYYHQIFRLCDDIQIFLANKNSNINTIFEDDQIFNPNDVKNNIKDEIKINYKSYYYNDFNLDRLNFFINVDNFITENIFNASIEFSYLTSFSNNKDNNIFSLKDNNIFSNFKRFLPSLKKLIPIPSENKNISIKSKFYKNSKKFLFLGNHENLAFWLNVFSEYFESISSKYEESLKYIALSEAISKAVDYLKIKNSYILFNISIILTSLTNFLNIRKLFPDMISNELLKNFKNNSIIKKNIFILDDDLIPEIKWNNIEEKNYLNIEIIKRYYGFLTDPCILSLSNWGLKVDEKNYLNLENADFEITNSPWINDGYDKNLNYKFNSESNKIKIEAEKNPLNPIIIPSNCINICDNSQKDISKDDDIFIEPENNKLFQDFYLEFNFDDWCNFVMISRNLQIKDEFNIENSNISSFIEIYVLNFERTNGWILSNISQSLASYLLIKDLKTLFLKRLVYENHLEFLFKYLAIIMKDLARDFCNYFIINDLQLYLKKEFQISLSKNHEILSYIKAFPDETKSFFENKFDASIMVYQATNEDVTDFYIFELLKIE